MQKAPRVPTVKHFHIGACLEQEQKAKKRERKKRNNKHVVWVWAVCAALILPETHCFKWVLAHSMTQTNRNSCPCASGERTKPWQHCHHCHSPPQTLIQKGGGGTKAGSGGGQTNTGRHCGQGLCASAQIYCTLSMWAWQTGNQGKRGQVESERTRERERQAMSVFTSYAELAVLQLQTQW